MKIVAIGDIHGRDIWKAIVEKEKDADRIIFVGDYLDSYDIGVKQQVKNFKKILEFKKEHPEKIILLFGNHDYHYLSQSVYDGERYSGFTYSTFKQVNVRMNSNVVNGTFQMCYVHGNLIFSHAGVTKTWCLNNNIDLDNLQQSINSLFRKDTYSFRFHLINPNGKSMSSSDPYGDNPYQSPIWVRPSSLIFDKPEGFLQIVGHTRTKAPSVGSYDGVYFLDCLDLVDGYLIIKDTEIIPSFL